MADYAALFSKLNFEKTIRKYCEDHGWGIFSINPEKAVLKFEGDTEDDPVQTLYIIRWDSTLEFSVPSGLAFEDEDDIPDHISTILLKGNATNKEGFWCIEKIGDRFVYSIMHNEEGRIIDSERFGVVVRTLVQECIKFEEAMAD